MASKGANATIFLIFSGSNVRAWTALAHFFKSQNVPFGIITWRPDDICYQTGFSQNIVFCRNNNDLTEQDLQSVHNHCSRRGFERKIICPTSEFLNNQFIQLSELLEKYGFIFGGANKENYLLTTNKATSKALFEQNDIKGPRLLSGEAIPIPCVAKPHTNILKSKVLYPWIILTEEEKKHFLDSENLTDYYLEEYLPGESYYLCYYFGLDGSIQKYSQRNLLQQPGGKSIVAAEISDIHTEKISSQVEHIFHGIDFHGPAMVELYKVKDDWRFIEVNPRFWGPLRLCFTGNVDLLKAFVFDFSGYRCETDVIGFETYIWYKGAIDHLNQLKRYDTEIDPTLFLESNRQVDVFNLPETQSLFLRY